MFTENTPIPNFAKRTRINLDDTEECFREAIQTFTTFTLVAQDYYKDKHYIMSKKFSMMESAENKRNFDNNVHAQDGYEEEILLMFRNIDNSKKRMAFRDMVNQLKKF